MPKPSVVKLTYFDLRQVVARVNREPVRVDPSKLGWSRWCAIGRTVSYHETWAEAVAAALAMCDARIRAIGRIAMGDERLQFSRDDPELDGTDAAHPAYWRGHDHAVAVLCQKITEILNGKDDGKGIASEPWEPVRRRLLALRNSRGWLFEKLARDSEAKLRKAVDALEEIECGAGQCGSGHGCGCDAACKAFARKARAALEGDREPAITIPETQVNCAAKPTFEERFGPWICCGCGKPHKYGELCR